MHFLHFDDDDNDDDVQDVVSCPRCSHPFWNYSIEWLFVLVLSLFAGFTLCDQVTTNRQRQAGKPRAE